MVWARLPVRIFPALSGKIYMKTHGLDYQPILVGNVWLSIHYEYTYSFALWKPGSRFKTYKTVARSNE